MQQDGKLNEFTNLAVRAKREKRDKWYGCVLREFEAFRD